MRNGRKSWSRVCASAGWTQSTAETGNRSPQGKRTRYRGRDVESNGKVLRLGEKCHPSLREGWHFERRAKLPRCLLEPGFEFSQRQFALQATALFAVADLAIECGQQIEGDVGGLEILALGSCDVVDQRSECGDPRRRQGLAAGGEGGSIDPRDQAGGDRFDIAFDAADLAREKHLGMSFHL